MTTSAIAHQKIVSQEEWLATRKDLLKKEKEPPHNKTTTHQHKETDHDHNRK